MEKSNADLQFHLHTGVSFKGQICVSAFCYLGSFSFRKKIHCQDIVINQKVKLNCEVQKKKKIYSQETVINQKVNRNCEVPTRQMVDNQGPEWRKAHSSLCQAIQITPLLLRGYISIKILVLQVQPHLDFWLHSKTVLK